MTLSEEEQQDYDNHVQQLRRMVSTIMEIGNDNPRATADDILDVVNDVIQDEIEDAE